MSERKASPNPDIVTNQRRAGAPGASVWVEANAGAGKTHVLTERVLRLLLSGVAPENLLCLTYTKAAAAEMRRRVADRLGAWAVMEEGELRDALTALEDTPPDAGTLHRARTLFGHALETPGGLKINTIHAFCESVLHRFPLEAGVPFAFTVIEEAEQAELIRAARDVVLAEGIEGRGPAAGAVARLFTELSDSQIEEAVNRALAAGTDLTHVLEDREGAKRRLRTLTGQPEDETLEGLREEVIGGSIFPPSDYDLVFAVTPPGDSTKFEDKLFRIDRANPAHADIFKAFLTGEGQVPKAFPKKALMEAPGGLGDRLLAEAQRLEALAERMKRARLILRSEALIDVLGAIRDSYEARKRARSRLDFDDLIARMAALVGSNHVRDWVRYKLDAGITHILVDESQDTNPEQWTVVRALSDEFFDGTGTAAMPRTLFAVGDKKQSIYSFQGAQPRLFSETGRELGLKARRAGNEWQDVRLKASFRTLPGILDAVDKVCARPDIAEALLTDGDPERHESARTDAGGTVTLWPPVQETDITLPDDRWPMDVDTLKFSKAASEAAKGIATTIKGWIDDRRPLAQRERAVTADDVLVLVQSRGALFQEIIRAVKRVGLPSPGSDRLPVSTHIAVLDLLALADVLLNPADDLNLAAVLRSPLFDVSEDDLHALAAHRGKRRLWAALADAGDGPAKQAYDRLRRWRGRLDFERPYEFFAEVLYTEGGLRRFHARLGEEVDDVLAEFLDLAFAHERAAQPSLQGFLAAMRASDISIKRDLAERGGGVRVMTVHGAKGLEAPIVILADAATGPNLQKLGKPVYVVPDAPGPVLVHASARKDHVDGTLAFREADEANQKAEYWRKLYVGMTRAEDELYVTGMLTKTGKLDGTWYEAIANALEPESAPVPAPGGEEGVIYPANPPEPKPITRAAGQGIGARTAYDAPPLPVPAPREIIRPSSAFRGTETLFESATESIADAEQARKQGIALHALLQHLCPIARAERHMVGLRALDVLLPEERDAHEALAGKAIAILEDPANAALFGPRSRAEVPFLADARKGEKPVRIAGRIDRLMVADDHVLAVDFKSDAAPPERAEDISAQYVTQVGLYTLALEKVFAPKPVRAAIFWTASESLMTLPEDAVAAAIAGFTLA